MSKKFQCTIVILFVLVLLISTASLFFTFHIYSTLKNSETPPKLSEQPLYRADYCVVPNEDLGTFDFYVKLYSTELTDWDTEISIYSYVNNRMTEDFTEKAVFSGGCSVVTIKNVPYEANNDIFVCFSYEKGPLNDSMDLLYMKIQSQWEWKIISHADGLDLNYTGYGLITGF